MSSAHSYEAGLHDLEKQLDAAPKPRKERPIESAPKKDGFVRTVGFAPSSTPPAHSPSSESLNSGDFLANYKRDASHAASLASSQVILVDRPPAAPGTTPDIASSGSLEGRSVLDSRSAKPAAAEEKPVPKQGRPEHIPPPKQKKQAEMSKAERRELQEKQRAEKEKLKAVAAGKAPAPKNNNKPPAAKSALGTTKPPSNPALAPPAPHGITKQPSYEGTPSSIPGGAAAPKLTKKKVRENLFAVPAHKQVPLFSHLPQYARSSSQQLDVGFTTQEIHPAIVSLGLKYADGTIRGGNARAVAMLSAFKEVIRDFPLSEGKPFSRSFENALKPLIQFLVESRPISVSMANAINFVKSELPRQATESLPDSEAKKGLLSKIDYYIQERIIASDQLITTAAVEKIADNDVVLTYACSYVVEQILIEANKKKKRFRVIVVDARPHLEGKEMLQRLVKEGVECTYVLLPALSYVMKGVKKVFVGAAAMMNNGGLLSRVGTAMIALMAKAHNVPFLVCCETYKFCERVQLDSICLNELGNPEELRVVPGVAEEVSVLRDWKSVEQLKLLHLKYDVTSPDLITCMITELGMVPPTSVPVVLREDHTERPAYHDDY